MSNPWPCDRCGLAVSLSPMATEYGPKWDVVEYEGECTAECGAVTGITVLEPHE